MRKAASARDLIERQAAFHARLLLFLPDLRHGRQKLHNLLKTDSDQVFQLQGIFHFIQFLQFVQHPKMGEPFGQRKEITVCGQNLPDMHPHSRLFFQKSHEKTSGQKPCCLLAALAFGKIPKQTRAGRFRHRTAQHGHIHQSRKHLSGVTVVPGLPDPVPVFPVQKICALRPFCKSCPQKFCLIEKTAHGKMFLFGKKLQNHLLLPCRLYLKPESSALFFKIQKQRRTQRIFKELSHLLSRIQFVKEPEGQIRRRTAFSLYKRRKRRIPEFIQPRFMFSPKRCQPFRHGKRADDIIGGKALLLLSCLPPRAYQLMKHRRFVIPVRNPLLQQTLPHLLIKARRLHAAGIPVQCVCRLHGIGKRIDSLILI